LKNYKDKLGMTTKENTLRLWNNYSKQKML